MITEHNKSVYVMTCDVCSLRSVRGITPATASQRAHRMGWSVAPRHICPICIEKKINEERYTNNLTSHE